MTAEKKVGDRVLRLAIGDIADQDVEAFVYDIRSDVKLGTGLGGAISVRGGKTVQQALDAIGTCPKGGAIITTAGKMKAEKIIHVNGPKFHEEDQEGKLKSAVENALKLADKNNISQLAFPPIGTGLYQVDLQLCARVMTDTIEKHLRGNSTSLKEVVIVALDPRESNPFQPIIGGQNA
jgi:O-acetyl-ADP-ribose deacetylase (regulator of RNase III)